LHLRPRLFLRNRSSDALVLRHCFFPSFSPTLLPTEILPPRKFPDTTLDFPSLSSLRTVFTLRFFPADVLLPKERTDITYLFFSRIFFLAVSPHNIFPSKGSGNFPFKFPPPPITCFPFSCARPRDFLELSLTLKVEIKRAPEVVSPIPLTCRAHFHFLPPFLERSPPPSFSFPYLAPSL